MKPICVYVNATHDNLTLHHEVMLLDEVFDLAVSSYYQLGNMLVEWNCLKIIEHYQLFSTFHYLFILFVWVSSL